MRLLTQPRFCRGLLWLNIMLCIGACAAIWRLGGIKYLLFTLTHNPVPAHYYDTADYYERVTIAPKMPNKKRVVLIGDSHIEFGRWSELLSDSTLEIINRGIAGDHSLGVVARLEPVKRLAPDVLVVQVGVNDLFFKSAARSLADYRVLLDTLTAGFPNIPLVVHKLMPVNNGVRRTGISPQAIRDFNSALEQMVKDYPHVTLIDNHTPLADKRGLLKPELTHDGIHLSGRAYIDWGLRLSAVLRQVLQQNR